MVGRALLTVAAAAMLVLTLVGCSASPASGVAGATTGSAHPTTTPGDGPRSSQREASSPDPSFDYGLVVQITRTGFHPQWLVSPCCQPVTWRNLTGSPAQVVFDHQLVNSGPIPPGGTFVFTPHNVQSIAYHSAINPSMIGVLQVNQTFES